VHGALVFAAAFTTRGNIGAGIREEHWRDQRIAEQDQQQQ
jgi:hypothetical protein